MPSPADVPSSPNRSDQYDVIIVGGGIVGTAIGYLLAVRGLRVAVLEKGSVAGEQSSKNNGWVRQQGRDLRELPLAVESLRLWRGLSKALGRDVGYRQCGSLYLLDTDEDHAHYARWIEAAKGFDLDTRLLQSDAVAAMVPSLGRRWKHGLYTASDGKAEPEIAAPALAEGIQDLGGHIVQKCCVHAIDVQAGRVHGVQTESGIIRAGAVVVAGGVWSSRLLRGAGIRLPQLKVRISAMRLSAVDGPSPCVWAPGISMRKRLDGGYTVTQGSKIIADLGLDSFRYARDFLPAVRAGWNDLHVRLNGRFVEDFRQSRALVTPGLIGQDVRELKAAPDHAILDRLHRDVVREMPVFAKADILERWAGYIDATPDGVPVIDRVDQVAGLFVATGFSGHGFGLSMGAASLLSRMVIGDDPPVDPAPYRLSRFMVGERHEVGRI